MKPYFEEKGITIYHGDCREAIPCLLDMSVDSVVCDPPYELGFMGKGWDRSGIAYDVSVWRECLRVLKPGGHLLAFGGSRTYHRLACAIEDAGFEIRDDIDFWYDANPIFAEFYDSLTDDQKALLHASAGAPHLSWIYGSGFPKSRDVGKDIEKIKVGGIKNLVQVGSRKGLNNENGTHGFSYSSEYVAGVSIGGKQINGEIPVYEITNEWNGWGTALKPAHEPIVLARKPLIGTVAENVLQHGTGGLNIDGCRIETGEPTSGGAYMSSSNGNAFGAVPKHYEGDGRKYSSQGRWPANVIHDGSDEVLAGFPSARSAGDYPSTSIGTGNGYTYLPQKPQGHLYRDSGSAARFFYCAKASKKDRNEGCDDLPQKKYSEANMTSRAEREARGERQDATARNNHPTVKPTELMRYLCRLVTPPNGLVLDPFGGSGSTAKACKREGFRCVLIEKELEYCELSKRRIAGQELLNFEAVA